MRSELRKLTTVRGPWLLLAVGPLIVVAGFSGLVLRLTVPSGEGDTRAAHA